MYLARERARRGDRDDAIPLMRAAVDHLFREGQLLLWGVPATGVLVETLLDRGADDDVAEAEAAIERLAAAPADEGLVIREIWLLRLRALLARAHGDDAPYREYPGSLPRHGEIAWLRRTYRVGRGNAMTAGLPLRAAGSHAEPLSPLRWCHGDAQHDKEPLRRDMPSAATSLGACRCASCATCATRQRWHSAGATGHSRPRPANMAHLRRRVVR